MKNLQPLLLTFLLLTSYGLMAQLSTSGTTTSTITKTEGKIGIGYGPSSIPNYQLSMGVGTDFTKIALYDDPITPAGIGFSTLTGQVRIHLRSSNGSFSFLDAPNGNELLKITGRGEETHTLRGVPNFNILMFGNSPYYQLAGFSADTAYGTVLRIGIATTSTGICSGCFSDLAKIGDLIMSNLSVANNSHFIVTNHSYLGSIKFSTKDLNAFSNGDKQRLEIRYDGKVVIGQSSDFTQSEPYPDGYNLFVSKGILAERIKCALANTSNWADYVFDSDYKLRSLTEVESFIRSNKHLPGVPSAEELVKEGVDMVGMDAKLLEKIEELTLYMIDVKNESAELKQHLTRMQKELDFLKKRK